VYSPSFIMMLFPIIFCILIIPEIIIVPLIEIVRMSKA